MTVGDNQRHREVEREDVEVGRMGADVQTRIRITAIGFSIGLLFWVIDGILDYLFFYSGRGFWEILLTEIPPHEVYIRTLALGLFGLFGYFTAHIVTHRQRALVEKSEGERRLEQINRILSTVRAINLLITHEKDRDRMLGEACSLLVESRGIFNAWIALVEDGRPIEPFFHAGFDNTFEPMAIRLREADPPKCARESLGSPGLEVIGNPTEDCPDCPLAKEYSGYSGLAIRLEHEGQVFGWLSASVSIEFAENEEARGLFTELASDIAFALHSLSHQKMRRQIGDALKNSEERFRSLTSLAPVGIFLTESDGNCIYVNEQWCEMTGLTPEQAKGDGWVRALHGDDIEKISQMWYDHAGETDVWEAEYRFKRPDGKVTWILGVASAIADHEGNITGHIGVTTDITERHEIELEHQKSRDRLSFVARASSDGIWDYDLDKGTIWWNEAYDEMLGPRPKDTSNSTEWWLERIHPEDRDRTLAEHRTALEGNTTRFECRYRFRLPNGEFIPILDRIIAVRTPDGRAKRVVGAMTDATEQMKIERARADRDALYHQVIANASGVAYRLVWSGSVGEGTYEFFGQEIEDLVGVPARDLTQARFISLIEEVQVLDPSTPSDSSDRYDRFADGSMKQYRADFRMHTPQGEEKWLSDCSLPLIDDETGKVIGSIGILQDITERKQAVEALRDSEYRLSRAQDIARMGSWEWDIREDITTWSPQTFKIFGLKPDELVPSYEVAKSFTHPDDVPAWIDAVNRALESENHGELDYRLIHPNGEIAWVHNEALVERDPNGNPLRMIGTIQDITERKQAVEAMIESEERRRLAMEAANQGLYDLDIQTGEAAVTPEYAMMLGYDPEEFEETNTRWTERLHPDDRERVAKVYADYIGGEVDEYKVEFRQRTRHGDWIWILSLGKIVELDEDGQPLRMLGTHTDITERKQAEIALQANEERYRQMFETNQAIKLIIEVEDGRIVEANEAAVNFYGYECDTLTSMNIAQINTLPTEEIRLEMEKALSGSKLKFEFKHRLASGDVRDVEVYSGPLHSGDKTLLFSIVHDVTERKQTEEALRASEERLRLALAASRQGFYDVDIPTGDVVVSPEYAMMLGHDPEVFTETVQNWRWRLHPDERDDVFQHYREYTRGERDSYEIVFRQRTATDEWKWIFSTGKILEWDEEGKPTRMLGTHTDITERKQIEEERDALVDLTRRLSGPLSSTEVAKIVAEESRKLFNHDAFAFSILDIAGNHLNWIYNEDTILGDEHPTATTISSAEFPLERSPVAHGEAVLINRNGDSNGDSLRTFGDRGRQSKSLMLAPLMWKDQVMGVLSTQSYSPGRYSEREFNVFRAFATEVGGVMARLREEEALEASEARLTSIFRATPAGIGVVVDRIIHEVNDRVCEMVGRSRDELVGRSSRIMYPTDEDFNFVGQEKYRQIRDHGTGNVETRWEHLDGTILDILLSSTPIDLNDRSKGVTFSAIDITERKKNERERESLRRLTQHLAGPTTLKEVGCAVAKESLNLFGHDAFVFGMLDTEKQLLTPLHVEDTAVGAAGPIEMANDGEAYPLSMSPAVDGVPKLIQRPDEKPTGDYKTFGVVARVSRSIMSAPLTWEGEMLGVLSAQSYTPDRYGERDFELFLTFVHQVSAVMARVRAEIALSESTRQLTTLMSNLPGTVYRCRNDKDWTMEFLSEGCEDLTGYTPTQVLNNAEISFGQIIHPDDRDRIWKEIQLARTENHAFEMEYRIICANDDVKWVWEQGRAVGETEDGLPILEGVISDVSDRRLAEAALRLHSEVYEGMDEAVIVSDRAGITLDVNVAAEKLFGWPREEMIGQNAEMLNPPSEAERITSEIVEGLEHESKWEGEIPLLCKSGELKLMQTSVTRLLDESGNWIGNIGINRDITERRRAEEALRNSEAHMRILIETIPDLIWVKDPEGVYLSCNPRFERFFGAPEREILGKTDYDFMDKEVAEFFRSNDQAAMAADGPRMNEEEVTYADDGHRELLETVKTPMRDAKGNLIGVLGIARDVTARNEAEKALEEQNRQLSVLNAVAHATAGSLSPVELGKSLVKIIRDTLPCDAFVLDFYSKETSKAQVIVCCDTIDGDFCVTDGADITIDSDSPLHQPLVVNHQHCLLHRSTADDDNGEFHPFGEETRRSMSLLFSPMIVGQRLIGIMSVQSYTPQAYSESDVELCLAIARQSAPALEAALLGEQLKEREQILDETGRMADVGGWEHDLESGKAVWTPALYDIIELDSGPPPGVNEHLAYYPPGHRERLEDAYWKCTQEYLPFDLELQVNTAKGKSIWARIFGKPVIVEGKCVKLQGTFQNVTARKQAEEAIEEQNERLSALNAVAMVATSSTSADELCDRLLGIVMTAMPCDAFHVTSYDGETGNLTFLRNFDTIDGEIQAVPPSVSYVQISERPHSTEVLAGKSVLIHREDPEAESDGHTRFGNVSRPSASILYAPLIVGESVVGVISAQSYTPNAYTEQDLDLLDAIARQAGPSLEAIVSSERLRESEEKYRGLFYSESDAVLLVDAETQMVIDVNLTATDLYGYTREEFMQCHATEITAEGKDTQEVFKKVADGSRVVVPRRLHRKKDGILFPVEISASSFRWGGRTVICGIIRDISERLRAENALKESEERLSAFMDSATDGFSIWDEKLNLLAHNETAAGFIPVGISREDAIGTNLAVLVPSSVPAGNYDRYLEVIKTGEPVSIHGYALEIPEGKRILNVRAFKVGDGLGIITSDITDREKAVGELERLSTAIEQADETVVITDTTGEIQYVNPAFERTTGHTKEEVIGQNPRILKSGKHDDSHYTELWTTISAGKTWEGRFVNKKKDGTLFTEEASISPVFDSAGNIVNFIAVKRNVSHEIELESQLRQAQKMEAIGQLAGGIAHDFNNLLMGILGHSDLALEVVTEEDDLHTDLTQIRKAGERAAGLTHQLLAFSRRQVLNTKDINLNEVIGGLLEMVGRLIGDNIRLKFIPGSEIDIVSADPGQIEQVLLNLIVNARDAMPSGGQITIEAASLDLDDAFCQTHSWANPGRFSYFKVTDTGSGISEEAQQHIFDPFYTTKGVGQGTGLGLSIVYGIIKQHGGFIDLVSGPDIGTAFTVFLPAIQGVSSQTEESDSGPISGGTETILLVEDEENVRNLLREYLKRAGYTVLTAESGEEAIRIFKEHSEEVEFALFDMMLPGLDGRETRDQIQALSPNLRCMFMSGYLPKESAEGHHDDQTPILPKPFDADMLLSQIRTILDA